MDEKICPKCGEIIKPQITSKSWVEVYICDNCGYDLAEEENNG